MKYYEDVGYSLGNYVNSDTETIATSHKMIIENADTREALTYLEWLLEYCYDSEPADWKGCIDPTLGRHTAMVRIEMGLEKTADEINRVLKTEGIL